MCIRDRSNSATLTVQDAGGSDNPDTPNNTYQIIDGANSSWTVSYTHLDVYKRQNLH